MNNKKTIVIPKKWWRRWSTFSLGLVWITTVGLQFVPAFLLLFAALSRLPPRGGMRLLRRRRRLRWCGQRLSVTTVRWVRGRQTERMAIFLD
jgi:hypothetical protein